MGGFLIDGFNVFQFSMNCKNPQFFGLQNEIGDVVLERISLC